MALADALLQHLGARFASPGLETQYRRFRASGYFLKGDGLRAGVQCAILATGWLRRLHREGATLGTVAAFSVLIGPVVQILMKWSAERRGGGPATLEAHVRHRLAFACLWRVAVMPAMGAICFVDYFKPPGAGARGGQVAMYILFDTGTVALFMNCVTYPLLLEHHLCLQPLATAMMALWCGWPFCRQAANTPDGSETVLSAWRSLDAASCGLLSAVLMGDVTGALEPPALPACRQVVLSAYAAMCLGAATYILWAMERRSRVEFLDVRMREGLGGGEREWAPVGSEVVFHGVLAAVGAALAWRGLGAALWDPGPAADSGCGAHERGGM
ncbi:unnamed protein product [Ostreobium quekettii]|uniref:Uncharacterized protein n=1 Tax=Ostreobium quekettii TaxID=121088 RepID=A0A8S1IVE2_9CHLO|nr:unnamed protein product [Ostreobium quekettii]|eukprot:evm.model.scf_43EXC.7 EVM.evm.TU.scf_43EXC.7   scf_43EXC:58234-59220(-)